MCSWLFWSLFACFAVNTYNFLRNIGFHCITKHNFKSKQRIIAYKVQTLFGNKG